MSAQIADDFLTEYLINHCYQRMMTALDESEQRHWCDRMTTYVKQRSPERVREMEREKGLA